MGRTPAPTVLIVDDEIDIRMVVRVVLETAQRTIEVVGEAVDGTDAVDVFDRIGGPEGPDVVILDHRMPGRSGLDVAREILQRSPDQRIILFGTTITPELEQEATALGVAACVGKLDVHRLPQVVFDVTETV